MERKKWFPSQYEEISITKFILDTDIVKINDICV